MLINREPSRAEQILTHALKYSTPCRSHEGLPCAIHPATPFVQEILPIRSILFRDWLADSFHREHELFPAAHAATQHSFVGRTPGPRGSPRTRSAHSRAERKTRNSETLN